MTLTLIKSLGKKDDGQSWSIYKCSYCKKEIERRVSNRKYRSCGCVKSKFVKKARTIHGDARAGEVKRLHNTWVHMKARCYNPNNRGFKYWGGKGIRVCDEWLDYRKFREWALSTGYKDNLTIDRLDDEKDYCPENCQWLTKTEHSKKSAAKYNGVIGINRKRSLQYERT